MEYGPTLPISKEVGQMKYLQEGESFKVGICRMADALKDDETHYHRFKEITLDQRFLPGGRVQSSMGATRETTAFNCFVMRTIPDSLSGITATLAEAAQTMKLGGGVGYDFSTLRPEGTLIKSLDSKSSGPLSFMTVFDAMCKTIASAGMRHGAQMGCMRVDHPDIEKFVVAKTNHHNLTDFNISVLVTDKFMEAVKNDEDFDLVWGGRTYKTLKARALWGKIMRATWDWAEPGVLFIDRINRKNNLYYCEEICATNPCGEQPLPPYGACLLGSFNQVKYLVHDEETNTYIYDWTKLAHDIPHVVRAMDNIIDRTTYPLKQQEEEAKNKRRMGLGVTGMANALEALGYPYGTDEYITMQSRIMEFIRDNVYRASIELAREKGPFPLFDRNKYISSEFIQTMPADIIHDISKHGIRNSHLLSVAPTGTISLYADNVSGGIEPVFSHWYDRKIKIGFNEHKVERVEDYGYRVFGVKGRTANELSVFDHVRVLNAASKYVDSACSKTCNVGDDVTWEEFQEIYLMAYEGGASGCTTFRASGERMGILTTDDEEPAELEEVPEGGACVITFDESGQMRRTCDM